MMNNTIKWFAKITALFFLLPLLFASCTKEIQPEEGSNSILTNIYRKASEFEKVGDGWYSFTFIPDYDPERGTVTLLNTKTVETENEDGIITQSYINELLTLNLEGQLQGRVLLENPEGSSAVHAGAVSDDVGYYITWEALDEDHFYSLYTLHSFEPDTGTLLRSEPLTRSEERRVGKECL